MFSLHRADLARSLLKDSMLTDLKFLLVTVLTLASGFFGIKVTKNSCTVREKLTDCGIILHDRVRLTSDYQIQSMTGVVSRSSYMLFKVHGFQNIQKIASDCVTSYVNVKIKIANDQDWFRG